MPQMRGRRTTSPTLSRTGITRTATITLCIRLPRPIAVSARPTLQRRARTAATASANTLAEPAHIMAVLRGKLFRRHIGGDLLSRRKIQIAFGSFGFADRKPFAAKVISRRRASLSNEAVLRKKNAAVVGYRRSRERLSSNHDYRK